MSKTSLWRMARNTCNYVLADWSVEFKLATCNSALVGDDGECVQ